MRRLSRADVVVAATIGSVAAVLLVAFRAPLWAVYASSLPLAFVWLAIDHRRHPRPPSPRSARRRASV